MAEHEVERDREFVPGIAGEIEPDGDGYKVHVHGRAPVTVADVSEALGLLAGQEPEPSPYELGETDDPDLTWKQAARLDAEFRAAGAEVPEDTRDFVPYPAWMETGPEREAGA